MTPVGQRVVDGRCLLLIAIVCSVLFAPASTHAHPQDGPHADVRIQISDNAVVFDIWMNLVFADAIVDAPREDFNRLHPVEHDVLREMLLEYLSQENHVIVDGVEVTPVLRSFAVPEAQPELLPLFPKSGMRGLQKIHIMLDYPLKSEPRSVAMKWAAYPENILLTTPDDPLFLEIAAELTAFGIYSIINFTRDEPEYIWHNTGVTPEERFMPVPEPKEPARLELPLVSLGIVASLLLATLVVAGVSGRRNAVLVLLIAAPGAIIGAILTADLLVIETQHPLDTGDDMPTAVEAKAIFEPLHANIYRAFDYTDESDIYDALARSVDGPLLDDLYNQIYQSLILQEEGGAVSRVQEVTPLDSTVQSVGVLGEDEVPGFQVRARWRVLGSVYHWGHSHSRLNEYEAEYVVLQRSTGWRIASTSVLSQERIPLEEEQELEQPLLFPPGTEL